MKFGNNRSVGHIGGDVDPNHMDAVAVLSMANWIMGELVRVYHALNVAEAQQLVDALAEVRTRWYGRTVPRSAYCSLPWAAASGTVAATYRHNPSTRVSGRAGKLERST